MQIISKFRDEELEHLDTGIEHDAEQVIIFVWNVTERNRTICTSQCSHVVLFYLSGTNVLIAIKRHQSRLHRCNLAVGARLTSYLSS